MSKFVLILKLVRFTFSLISYRLNLLVSAKFHNLTYRPVPQPKNVVVIGGSFAGYYLAKSLAESLPTGYRVVVIERHSHFHFTWNFPRATVVKGADIEHNAFIPYPDKPSSAAEGSFLFKHGTVVNIEAGKVVLQDGEEIAYEYLALATGSQKRYPAKLDVDGDEKHACVAFFQTDQSRIQAAQSIVIVGGGAAGVEVAGDIKSKYPDKSVALVHSREHLLNSFGEGLHVEAAKGLRELGVDLFLGDRVIAGLDLEGPGEVALRSGKALQCDLLIKCTGQVPNTQLLKLFSPTSISASTGGILVGPGLEVRNSPSPGKIFALGDVVDRAGPKTGRGATVQAFFVADNILRSIHGKALKEYVPSMVEQSIELTLGVKRNVTYISDGTNYLALSKKMTDESMHAAQAWRMLDAKPFHDPGYDKVAKTSA